MRWQALSKEFNIGSDIYRRIFILKLIATFNFFSETYCTITCHCLNNEWCNHVDGSCPNGCAQGWHGPGCQIGNLALGKPAYQSSTYAIYSADYAVNGVWPPRGDLSESNCSHTVVSSDLPHWWYVSLSETEDYVLKNVTIVNRQKPHDSELRSFYILYTNESTGQPNLTSWKQCMYQSNYQSVIEATYTCSSGTAIGRRVAIYFDVRPLYRYNRKLVLCEVIVNGYSYQETAMFRYRRITVTSNRDILTVTLGALPVVLPTFLVVYMNTSRGIPNSREERIRSDGTRSVTIQATSNLTYSVSVALETCCIGSMCLNDQAAAIERSKCVVGPSTMPVSIELLQYKTYTANFSSTNLKETITCNSITLSIENVPIRRDLQPALIYFYLSSTEANETHAQCVSAPFTGSISVSFMVVSNVTYTAWAVPMTCWIITDTAELVDGSCNDLRNCIAGERSPVKYVTTRQHQYFLETRGCCASFSDKSSKQCESPVSYNIRCTSQDDISHEVLESVNGLLCGFKPNTNYTCNHTVYERSGKLNIYSQIWKTGYLPECSSYEDSQVPQNIFSALVVVGVCAFCLLITVIIAFLVYRNRTQKISSERTRPSQMVDQCNKSLTNEHEDRAVNMNIGQTSLRPSSSSISESSTNSTKIIIISGAMPTDNVHII